MKRIARLIALLCIAVASLIAASSAAVAGTLKGKIVDASSSELVIGASVSLQGTTIGAVTNASGEYTIKNIPAGNYTVRFAVVGYSTIQKPMICSDEPNEVVTLDAALLQSSVMASEVIVSASKYEQNKFDVPVTTTVVSNKLIAAKPVQTLDQVLEAVPGVDIIRAGGMGASNVQIRGSNSFAGGGLGTRVVMLYDGFPMNSADANSVDWATASMSNIDRLEVIKGGFSSLYGSAAMGGVINAIAALPSELDFKVRLTSGFYDRPPVEVNSAVYPGKRTPYFYNATAVLGNQIGNFAYNLSYSRLTDEGYRETSQIGMNDVKVKARYTLNPSQYLQLSSIFSWGEGGVPAAYTTELNALAAADPKDPLSPDSSNRFNDDMKRVESQLVGLTFGTVFSNAASFETKAYMNRNRFTIIYYPKFLSAFNVKDANGNVIDNYQDYSSGDRHVYDPNDPTTFNDSDARRYGLGSTLNLMLGSTHRIMSGIDGNYESVRSTLYYNNAAVSFGGFIQDELALGDKLKLTLALRYDFNQVEAESVTFTNQLTGLKQTEPLTNRTMQQLSPRASATYRFNEEMSARASVGRSFRAPSLGERFITNAGFFRGNPNPDLTAERMTSYEIGVLKSFSKYVSLDASIYLNDYNGLIEANNINPDSNAVKADISKSVFEYFNVSLARIYGLEVSLNLRPVDQVNVQLGYNYMNAKDLDPSSTDRRLGGNANPPQANGQPNDWLSYRPEHNFNFRADVSLLGWAPGVLSNVSLSYSGRYVGKINAIRIAANKDGEGYPGSFLVMDAAARYELSNKFDVLLTVRNLGNTQYEELENFRAAGRSFTFSLNYAF